MLKKCIFNGCVIPCDVLFFLCLASCLTSNVFTQLRLIWVLTFNWYRKICYFSKNVTFIILDGSLQLCSLVNILNAYIR